MAEEKQYPYTTVPNKLRLLLGKLPGLGKPDNVSQKWLKELGYTSGNDKTILAAMRRVGMVASGGDPTDLYQAFRDKDKAKVADGVRRAYSDLFGLYPDAHQKDAEALRNFFRSKTTAGEDMQRAMVRTFQVFCEFGDFGAAPAQPTVAAPDTGGEELPSEETRVIHRAAGGGLTLNVNIQLQLPPSADGEVYEKLFEAMGKHLKDLASLE
jgi:hypothetical protein